MSIACRVQEQCWHEFTHANQIHEIWLTSGTHSSKSGTHADVAIFWKYRDWAFIWHRSSLHSTLRSCTTGAWIWPSREASKPVYSVLTQWREHVQQSRELCRLLTTKNTHISKDKLFALTFFGTVGAQVCFSKPSGMAILLHGNRIL